MTPLLTGGQFGVLNGRVRLWDSVVLLTGLVTRSMLNRARRHTGKTA
jgi:hypothetical protein